MFESNSNHCELVVPEKEDKRILTIDQDCLLHVLGIMTLVRRDEVQIVRNAAHASMLTKIVPINTRQENEPCAIRSSLLPKLPRQSARYLEVYFGNVSQKIVHLSRKGHLPQIGRAHV